MMIAFNSSAGVLMLVTSNIRFDIFAENKYTFYRNKKNK